MEFNSGFKGLTVDFLGNSAAHYVATVYRNETSPSELRRLSQVRYNY